MPIFHIQFTSGEDIYVTAETRVKQGKEHVFYDDKMIATLRIPRHGIKGIRTLGPTEVPPKRKHKYQVRTNEKITNWYARLYDLSTGDVKQITNPRYPKSIPIAHATPVTALAGLPEARIVTADGYGHARIWDADGDCDTHGARLLLHELEGHKKAINAIAVLPNGNFVTASRDGTAKVWDYQSGVMLHSLEGHTHNVTAVAALPNGDIVTGSADGTAKTWDGRTGTPLHTLRHSGSVDALAVLANGNIVLRGGWVMGQVKDAGTVWDSHKGTLLFTLADQKHIRIFESSLVGSLADGNIVTAAANIANIWCGRTGALLHTLKGDTYKMVGTRSFVIDVKAILPLPDGNLATGSSDGKAAIWNTQTGQILHTLNRERSISVNSLGILPNGDIVTGHACLNWCQDLLLGEGNVWNGRTGTHKQTLDGYDGEVMLVTVLPGWNIATVDEYGHVKIWS